MAAKKSEKKGSPESLYWRDRPPTIDECRAHNAAHHVYDGAWWMYLRPCDPSDMVGILQLGEGISSLVFEVHSPGCQWRPLSATGDPVPWPTVQTSGKRRVR
jgi:hypothetical protein